MTNEHETRQIPLLAARPVAMRSLGYDEHWLQDWLAADPSRLGLGDVTLVEQEQRQGGGALDLLALDPGSDTYYSVEVQLGEIDASHSFRVFDYWARNRQRLQGKTHVAVLCAENTRGRFRAALEALAETVPLVVIEFACWQGRSEAVLVPEIVIANASLDLADTPAGTTGEERTEADWRGELTPAAWQFNEAFVEWVRTELGEVVVSYSAQSYVGVRVGRRTWAPLWPRQDGATIYLPDPDGERSERPSLAFERFEESLRAEGLSPTWQPSYNAKANPICLRLRIEDLQRPVVQELLRASFEILRPGAVPWHERQEVGVNGDNHARVIAPPTTTDAAAPS